MLWHHITAMTIHDISLTISEALPIWPGDPPLQMTQPAQLAKGDPYTLTQLNMSAHTGTHVDAPSHFFQEGTGIDALDLDVLVGQALVVDVGNADAITAPLLENLELPANTKRSLFRTRNSRLWTQGETQFVEDFVAITSDGARWLVDYGVKLVGVDYLSISPFADPIPTHQILLGAGVIPVEGLNLSGIAPGEYQLVCLPLKIAGGDGAPARAILIELDT